MSAKRKHRSTNEYLEYLKGGLSRKERYSFERDLEADPFEMEAMEGMAQLSPEELEEDLLTIHATLNKRLRRRRRRTLYSIAAGIASILIVGTVFLNIYEINPKTGSELIPSDESFLQEDTFDAEKVDQEQTKTLEAPEVQEEAQAQVEAQARETTQAQEGGQAQVEAQAHETAQAQKEARRREEILIQEEEALVPEEDILYAAELPVEKVMDDVMISEEVEAPAPVATEVLAVEAQPKRSQKKGRTPDAAMAYTDNRVSGVVVSAEDQEPLPGASLLVKGRDSGMVADMDGRFSLVADQEDPTTVIASYVGMETGEYQLAEGKENLLVMQPDLATLNEVVIVEYATEKETYPRGAVNKVQLDKENFEYSGARPEGGLEAYKMYIEEQIRFPAGDTLSKREVVVLKFTVMKDGTISKFETLRSPGDLFTEEALRLLQEGPVWNPARDESGITEDVVRMRIVFKRQ